MFTTHPGSDLAQEIVLVRYGSRTDIHGNSAYGVVSL